MIRDEPPKLVDRPEACANCGSDRTTVIAMALSDGTQLRKITCRRCENATWVDSEGTRMESAEALARLTEAPPKGRRKRAK